MMGDVSSFHENADRFFTSVKQVSHSTYNVFILGKSTKYMQKENITERWK